MEAFGEAQTIFPTPGMFFGSVHKSREDNPVSTQEEKPDVTHMIGNMDDSLEQELAFIPKYNRYSNKDGRCAVASLCKNEYEEMNSS